MHRRPAIASLAAVLAFPALAHHGWSQYADDRPLTLTGTITEASYEFPHGTVRLQTDDKTWTVVLAPPSRMANRGLAREALKPGVPATVVGYPHKTVADELRAERITLNGTTTELR
ncbi:MAG: hypothetical protein K2Y35_12245 [Burkholderiales bacterium]|nr:hypothetical protein [Burkholderiales bacterium]